MIRVDDIKARVSVTDLFEKDGHKLTKVGDHWRCLCPWHKEKTPSCHVWTNHFYCFGCTLHGDAITYIERTRGCDFMEALNILDGQRSEPVTWRPLPSRREEPARNFGPQLQTWFRETDYNWRYDFAYKIGVSSDSLTRLHASWAPEHTAWAFPMYDSLRKVIGIRLRTVSGDKFAVKGSKQGLFLPSDPPYNRIYICEGPTDTAACLSLGVYAIGRPSCNGCVDEILGFLSRNRVIREVVIVTDNDTPGINGAEALREKLPVKSWQLLLPSKDIRKFVQVGGGRLLIENMLASQVPRIP